MAGGGRHRGAGGLLELLSAGSGQQDPDPAGDSHCRAPRVVSTPWVLAGRHAVCGLPVSMQVDTDVQNRASIASTVW